MMKGKFAWKCGAPTIVDAQAVPCHGSMQVDFHCAICGHKESTDKLTSNDIPLSEIVLHDDYEELDVSDTSK